MRSKYIIRLRIIRVCINYTLTRTRTDRTKGVFNYPRGRSETRGRGGDGVRGGSGGGVDGGAVRREERATVPY